MASSFFETMTSLRAQIKDNFRFVYRIYETEPIVAVATHDNLCWVIVHAKETPYIYASDNGHKSDQDALQEMAKDLSDRVWKMAKDNQITLPK